MFAVFPEVIHTLDPSITDEQIQKAVIDFKEGNILSEGYILGNRLVITYVPLLFRDDGSWLASSRIDISVSSEEIAKEIELDALQAFFVTINEDMTREDVDAIMEGLSHLADKDFSYRYARIGESYDARSAGVGETTAHTLG